VEKPGHFAESAQQALTTRCWLSEEKIESAATPPGHLHDIEPLPTW